MYYTSTRDKSVSVSSAHAIAHGISPDGGLFVPCEFPQITADELAGLRSCNYAQRAELVLSKFLTDFSREEISECVRQAYCTGNFDDSENVAPVVDIDDYNYILELWHGPTCAFKDMALQLLPHLLTRSLKKTGIDKEAVILVATSGDTGKAALEGFKDVENTRIIVFYPEDGVSAMQKLQMVTQEGGNVGVCAIKGNFDDAQSGVKRIFTDKNTAEILSANGMMFSSANSINWGRLVPQIVYYISAYLELMETGEIDYIGEKVNFVVPTGNFGNILAAYYAMRMGLPVNKLICASNSNNILTDFINTGVYDKNRQFHTTISPSMDILISSNLERLLFELTGKNDSATRELMNSLSVNGKYTVDASVKAQLDELFFAGCCDDRATKATIKSVFDAKGYLCDTHTAVGMNVLRQYREATGDTETPTILASTANPFKFSSSVLEALSGEVLSADEFSKVNALSVVSQMQIPASLMELNGKPVRFEDTCTGDSMQQEVFKLLGI